MMKDYIILITGAAQGIGNAVTTALCEQGATVILLDNNKQKLNYFYDELQNAGYHKTRILPIDLAQADPEQYQEIAQEIKAQFGNLHGLIHNAVAFNGLTPLEHIDPLRWHQEIQVNLNAAFLLTQACLPLLKTTAYSRIIFTGDHQYLENPAYWGSYAVTKPAIEQLTKVLARELLNFPTRVNCIVPPRVNTALLNAAYADFSTFKTVNVNNIIPFYIHLMSAASQDVHGEIIAIQL